MPNTTDATAVIRPNTKLCVTEINKLAIASNKDTIAIICPHGNHYIILTTILVPLL